MAAQIATINFDPYRFDEPIVNGDNVYQILRGNLVRNTNGQRFRMNNQAGGYGHISRFVSPAENPAQGGPNPTREIAMFLSQDGIDNIQVQVAGNNVDIAEPNFPTYPKCIYYRANEADIIVVSQYQAQDGEDEDLIRRTNLYNALRKAVSLIPIAAIDAFIVPAYMNAEIQSTLYNGANAQNPQGQAINIRRIHSLHPLMIILLLENITRHAYTVYDDAYQQAAVQAVGGAAAERAAGQAAGQAAAQPEIEKINTILSALTREQRSVLLSYNTSNELIQMYVGWLDSVGQTRNPRQMADVTVQLINRLVERSMTLNEQLVAAQQQVIATEAARAQMEIERNAALQAVQDAADAAAAPGGPQQQAQQAQQAQQQAEADLLQAEADLEQAQNQLQARTQELVAARAECDRLRAENRSLQTTIMMLKSKLSDYQYLHNSIFGALQNAYTTSTQMNAATHVQAKEVITGLLAPGGQPILGIVGGGKKRKIKGGEVSVFKSELSAMNKYSNLINGNIYKPIKENQEFKNIISSINLISEGYSQESFTNLIKNIDGLLNKQTNETMKSKISKYLYSLIGDKKGMVNNSNINVKKAHETIQINKLKEFFNTNGSGKLVLKSNKNVKNIPYLSILSSSNNLNSLSAENKNMILKAQEFIKEHRKVVTPPNAPVTTASTSANNSTVNPNKIMNINRLESSIKSIVENTSKAPKNKFNAIYNLKINNSVTKPMLNKRKSEELIKIYIQYLRTFNLTNETIKSYLPRYDSHSQNITFYIYVGNQTEEKRIVSALEEAEFNKILQEAIQNNPIPKNASASTAQVTTAPTNATVVTSKKLLSSNDINKLISNYNPSANNATKSTELEGIQYIIDSNEFNITNQQKDKLLDHYHTILQSIKNNTEHKNEGQIKNIMSQYKPYKNRVSKNASTAQVTTAPVPTVPVATAPVKKKISNFFNINGNDVEFKENVRISNIEKLIKNKTLRENKEILQNNSLSNENREKIKNFINRNPVNNSTLPMLQNENINKLTNDEIEGELNSIQDLLEHIKAQARISKSGRNKQLEYYNKLFTKLNPKKDSDVNRKYSSYKPYKKYKNSQTA